MYDTIIAGLKSLWEYNVPEGLLAHRIIGLTQSDETMRISQSQCDCSYTQESNQ